MGERVHQYAWYFLGGKIKVPHGNPDEKNEGTWWKSWRSCVKLPLVVEWESPERTFLTLQGLDHTQIENHWKIFVSQTEMIEKSLKTISDKSNAHSSNVWQIIDNYFWLPGTLATFAPISHVQQNIISGTFVGLQLLHKQYP